jgi:hypothetical protein
MNPLYAKLIVDATKVEDANSVMGIEGIMRDEHPTLDHLTRRELVRLARRAHKTWAKWNGDRDSLGQAMRARTRRQRP